MNIVFDLDGTLIDSAPDIQEVASKVLRPRGRSDLSIEETRRFVGEGAAVFVERMLDARELPASDFLAIHKEFLAHYEGAVDKAIFYPHVVDTLETLIERGHNLGLCTNKPEAPARAVISHMKLQTHFDAFVAGGMTAKRKPEPEMLLLAINQLGGGKTVYVGDSEIDAHTAERANVPFALFTEGYRKTPVHELTCEWTFSDFRELIDIVGMANTDT